MLGQHQQSSSHHLGDLFARLFEPGHQRAQPLIALCRNDPKLAQGRPQRVPRHRPLPNQQGPRAVNRKRRLLLDALDRNKAHRWPGHRLADPFRIPSVILVALD